MQDSRVIEIDGVFLGAAVSMPGVAGWRIVAADARVVKLDGTVAPTLQAVQRLARQAYMSARVVPTFALAACATT
jgi:hypothetical protein